MLGMCVSIWYAGMHVCSHGAWVTQMQCTCMWRPVFDVRCGVILYHTPYIETRSLTWTQTFQLDNLAIELASQAAGAASQALRIGAGCHICLSLTQCWGSELWSSWVHSKCFTYWAVFPAHSCIPLLLISHFCAPYRSLSQWWWREF